MLVLQADLRNMKKTKSRKKTGMVLERKVIVERQVSSVVGGNMQ